MATIKPKLSIFPKRGFFGKFHLGALSGLRQFLATESPLKMMKNALRFTSKALFILKTFKFFKVLRLIFSI